MAELFGSDSMFRRMKRAAQTDRDELGDLVYEQVRLAMAINRRKYAFLANVSRYDAEDMEMAAFEKAWRSIDRFLNEPGNDPDQDMPGKRSEAARQSWLNSLVLNCMMDVMQRQIIGNNGKKINGQFVSLVSANTPIGEDGDSTLADLLPSNDPAVGEQLVMEDALTEAFDRLFVLPNETGTLAAVAYAMLADDADAGLSGKELAAALSGIRLVSALAQMYAWLDSLGIDRRVLRTLEERIRREGPDAMMPALTDSKLSNRKNAVLTALRRSDADAPPSDKRARKGDH